MRVWSKEKGEKCINTTNEQKNIKNNLYESVEKKINTGTVNRRENVLNSSWKKNIEIKMDD